MKTMRSRIPKMPEIGHSEAYYATYGRRAERHGEQHLHESFKVGQYVTLALDPHLQWEDKLRYFRHALNRHCQAPPFPEEDVWLFYRDLANLVRHQAGREALRLACLEDDRWAREVEMGRPRDKISDEAAIFFRRLMPQAECPDWCTEDDWRQMRMLRDAWSCT